MNSTPLSALQESISSLSDSEKLELDQLLREETPVWTPLPGPQSAARASLADLLFYGGAGGGGKTDLAAGLSLTEHVDSLIIRQELKQTRTIAKRMGEIVGSMRPYRQDQDFRWGGRTVEFGGLRNPGDEETWRGRPHDLLIVDEAPTMREDQVKFIMGWVRTTLPGQRCRIVLTGNPPRTAEGYWMVEMFGPWLDEKHELYPYEPGRLLWYAILDGKDTQVDDGVPFVYKGELIKPKSRTFIPAKVDDNPFLVATGYKAQLQALPEPLRSQMLYGDFAAGKEDQAWQVIPTAWVQAAMDRWTERKDGAKGMMTSMGLDVSRGGRDKTVWAPRYGWWYDRLITEEGVNTDDGPKVAGLTVQYQRNGCPVFTDVVNVGTSVVDFLRQANINVEPVNGAERAQLMDETGLLRFANKRAQYHWKFRELLDPAKAEDPVALPPDPELKKDLCAPTYRVTPQGILIELKEQVIKRLGRSPDKGDAVVYASGEAPPISSTGRGRLSDGRQDLNKLGWNADIPYED